VYNNLLMTCPYHTNQYPAADRAAIWRDLHAGFSYATDVLIDAASQYNNEFEPYANELSPTMLAPSRMPLPDEKRYEIASKSIDAFVAASVETEYASSDFTPLRIPIGRAGKDTAAHTLTSVGWLAQLCDRPGVDVQLNTIADNYADVLINHTFRGVASGDPRDALRNDLQQGLAIIGQSYGILTIDTPSKEIPELEWRLASEKRIQLLARSIGGGAMSSVIRHARYIPRPLKDNAGFAESLETFNTITREDSKARVAEQRELEALLTEFDPDVHLAANMGGTCPATKGPIQILSAVVAEHNQKQRAFGA
jgi:hypothetical protein